MAAGCYDISPHTAARVATGPSSLSTLQVSPSSMHNGHHFRACHFQMRQGRGSGSLQHGTVCHWILN